MCIHDKRIDFCDKVNLFLQIEINFLQKKYYY